jgi:hypothetical protein
MRVHDTSAFASKFAPRSILLMRSVRNWDPVWAPLSVALEPYAHVGRTEQRLETRRQNLFLGDTIRYQPGRLVPGW